MLEEKHIEFQSNDVLLRGRFLLPPAFDACVVMCTGDGQSGSRGLSWTNYPELFGAVNIATFAFDFAGLGSSEGDRRVLSLSTGIANFRDALRAVQRASEIRGKRLGVLAASFGGNVALLSLSRDPAEVEALALKSPSIDLYDCYVFDKGHEFMAAWKAAGYSEELGYSWSVMEDAQTYNPHNDLPNLSIPCLITHGLGDELVPIEQSREIIRLIRGTAEILEMRGVNHHYSDRDDWDRMAAVHVGWLSYMLRRNHDKKR